MSIHRRSLLTGAANAVALARFQPSKDCRVAIAGAIADPGDAGRAFARQKSGAGRDYRDHREMMRGAKVEFPLRNSKQLR